MIEIKKLNKSYGEKEVYKDFNLNVEENKILVVLGESGSGKTTLLNVIANLTDYDGEVLGVKRPVSMVFREDRLIPNLTVEENLRLINPQMNVKEELEKVGLYGKASCFG